jgi:ABC-type multidrug transport system ATPase subunit
MSELSFQGVADGPVFGVNARLGPGTAVVLGMDPAALSTLVAVASGVRTPSRGLVLLDGQSLHTRPELRRATGTLLAEESLPPFGKVADAVNAILAARGDRRLAEPVLGEAGLGGWGPRRSRDLDASERRTLLCALALAHQSPRLLALYEPLAAGRGLSADFVRHALERASNAGAVVLIATRSLDDARSLGGVPWVLDQGSLTSVGNEALGAPAGSDQTFVIDTSDARRLTVALTRDPAVSGVRWSSEHAPDTVFVFGSDTERLASAIVRTIAEERTSIRSIALAPLPLEALLATRAHAARMLAPNPFVGSAHGAQPYGAQPYGAQPYGAQPYGAQPYGAQPYEAQPYGAAPQGATPFGEEPPTGVYVPGAADPAGRPQVAPSPADQSVSMPTGFADPTRPSGGGRS